jgi:hypothetical protein
MVSRVESPRREARNDQSQIKGGLLIQAAWKVKSKNQRYMRMKVISKNAARSISRETRITETLP